MARNSGRIEVEGLKEFQRAARRSTDRELPKRLGQANKKIGDLVISRLDPRPDPAAVGTGAGATVRSSASKREVLLRVGGAHRADAPRSPWGKRRGAPPGTSVPARPHIIGTADRHRDEFSREWLKAVSQAMSPAFHRTET